MSIIKQDYGSLGSSSKWAVDIYGNVMEKTLATNDTEVAFDIPDNTDDHCYILCCSTASATTPNTQPPKTTASIPTYDSSSISGCKKIKYPLTTVTSDQNGSKCRLLVVQ